VDIRLYTSKSGEPRDNEEVVKKERGTEYREGKGKKRESV
jgi:hypothetical protein